MSENENIENEIKDDEMLEEAADIEAAADAPVEEDVAIVEDDADDVDADEAGDIAAEAKQVVEAADAVAEAVEGDGDEAAEEEPERNLGEELIAKIKRAEGLLFRRRIAMERAAEEKASQVNELARAIKLLDLKPKMEQKEMADLLGVRLRELDALLADAEKCDLVGRIEVTDPETGNVDMRKVVVFASEDAVDHVGDIARQTEPVVPGLSDEDMELLFAQLDKVINPLAAMGLDDERGGRDDRGPRGGFGGRGGRDDRGGRGGFGGRGGDRRDSGDRSHGKFGSPRMGFGGSRGGHSDRGGFGGRDDRGGRGGFGDRGGRGGFGGRDRDDRGSRGGFGGNRGGYGDRGGRGGFGGRDDRGGSRGGFGGNRGGYGDRGGNRGGYGDRGGRGGFGGRDRY